MCDGRWRGLLDPRLRSPDSEHSWTLQERQRPSNSSLRGVRESIERLPFFLHSARLLFRTLPHRRRQRARNATQMAALVGADSGMKRRSRHLPWRNSRHKSHTFVPTRPGKDILDCVRDEKVRDRAIVADGGVRGVFRRTGSILEPRQGRRKRRATVEVMLRPGDLAASLPDLASEHHFEAPVRHNSQEHFNTLDSVTMVRAGRWSGSEHSGSSKKVEKDGRDDQEVRLETEKEGMDAERRKTSITTR